MSVELKAITREPKTSGELRDLRGDFKIPGVVFGKGRKNQSITISYPEFMKILNTAGTSSIVDLKIDGSQAIQVIIADLQRDAIKDRVIHVDLHQVRMDEKIKTEISLHFVGEAPAVKTLGANLIISKDKLHIECLPKDLISGIDVDLSGLAAFDESIHVKDIKLPAGITVIGDLEDSIVSVLAPRTEEIPLEAPVTEEAAVAAAEPAEGGEEASAETPKTAAKPAKK